MTADLSVVRDDSTPVEPEYEDRFKTPANIPDFEGKPVGFTKAKVTSTTLDIDDQVFRLDEYVRMEVEGRISAVDHKVNDKTGALERIHTIKVVDSKILNWEDER